MVLLLMLAACTYIPSCEEEASAVGWDEQTPTGRSAAEVAELAGGAWEEELVYGDEAGSTGLIVEVDGFGEASWVDSEHTHVRWYHTSQALMSVTCVDSLEVPATMSLGTEDMLIDEVVEIVRTSSPWPHSTRLTTM